MTRAALIIEDDPTLAELVRLHLRDIDCAADIADDGVTGLDMFKDGRYELVVLDIMLPRKDGLRVCRDIRRLPGYVPILMLTAKSTELDRVRGLETGADDYLTKPFSVRELVARVKALLRRVDALSPDAASGIENEIIEHGNLRIAVGKRQVTVDD
jgi:DNA-binding response OmpR family regulator